MIKKNSTAKISREIQEHSITLTSEKFAQSSQNEFAHPMIGKLSLLWFSEKRLAAAFDFTCASKPEEGMLNIGDLVVTMPDAAFPIYIVAPKRAQARIRFQLTRPSFTSESCPTHRVTRLLPLERLLKLASMDIAACSGTDLLDAVSERFPPFSVVDQ